MNLLWLALAWAAYALLHSMLASLACKAWVARRWPAVVPYYRLAFNAVATLTLLPILWLSTAIGGDWLWRWPGIASWVANGLALAACVGFIVSTRYYDMDEFLGLRPWRGQVADGTEHDSFIISPFHRYVRHPWYCFGLVLVWSRDMNAAGLISALAITAYFIVGSRLEEKKLLACHGAGYRAYMERVAGLFPIPWKILSREDARRLSTA